MNCAAVQIGEGSGNTTTPTNPAAPSVSATKPSKPSSSGYQPSQPDEEPQYSVAPQPTSTRAAGKPSYPTESVSPTQPDDEESTEEPSDDAPTEDDSEETDDSENTDDSSDEEDSNNDYEESDSEDTDDKWSGRPGRWNPHRHQTVKYKMVDGHKCKIDIVSKRAECVPKDSNGSSPQKRTLVERKAVRMARRDALKKRADACAWDSAPSMVVSYYTVDAACAPNAKMNVPESDAFEIAWNEPCGVVEGDGEYPIKDMDCNMFS